MVYVVGKFMARSGIKGHYILLRGDTKDLSDNSDETKYKVVNAMLK